MSILFNEIIFGPIKSRRLGISLGINLLPVNGKICNFDCIYCECGWNADGRIKTPSFHSQEEVKQALENKLATMSPLPDSITFSGNGEPTMHPDFAAIMNNVVELRDKYAPEALVSVLSNATMIHKPDVFNALQKANRAILKFDSGITETANIINCPQGNYSVETAIEKLKAFDGNMILQTMFLRGEHNGQKIDNTTEKEINAWIEAITQINPKEITIYSIDRETPTKNLEKVSKDELENIASRVRQLGYKVQVSGELKIAMEKYTDITSLQNRLAELSNKTIGFVPTMGALHRGHLSLIDMCKSTCNITVASVFVNPTQFNDKDDYKKYPRMPEKDMLMLENAGCDIVFMPSESEIYPKEDKRVFNFGDLDKVMEGKFRAGHFNGVAQIVSRLFEIVQPNKAFFGQKDLQQVAIIKNMVQQLNLTTEIVVAPIIRENDGLAMSSRNMLLSQSQRESASAIFQSLVLAKQQVDEKSSIEKIKENVSTKINSDPNLKIEYIEIVDENMQPIANWEKSQEIYACIAVRVGNVRLIDNMQLK